MRIVSAISGASTKTVHMDKLFENGRKSEFLIVLSSNYASSISGTSIKNCAAGKNSKFKNRFLAYSIEDKVRRPIVVDDEISKKLCIRMWLSNSIGTENHFADWKNHFVDFRPFPLSNVKPESALETSLVWRPDEKNRFVRDMAND